MAKRKSNRRRRAGGYQRRSRNPPAGVGRHVKLDDLLAPRATTATAPALEDIPRPQIEVRPPEPDKPKLEPVPDLVPGPHVRLGAIWALITFVAAGAGVIAIAVWFALAAVIAAIQTAASWRTKPRQPSILVAAIGAAALPLAASISVGVLAGATLAVAIAALAHRPERNTAPVLTLAIAVGIGLAAASPVVVRRLGLVEVIFLLGLVGVYDASAYLVGTGATREWEGPAAGVAFMFAVTLAAAALFVPPFSGFSPWFLGAVAAATAPFGPRIAPSLVGDERARAPGLGRLDSLLILGPLWAALAYVLV